MTTQRHLTVQFPPQVLHTYTSVRLLKHPIEQMNRDAWSVPFATQTFDDFGTLIDLCQFQEALVEAGIYSYILSGLLLRFYIGHDREAALPHMWVIMRLLREAFGAELVFTEVTGDGLVPVIVGDLVGLPA